MTMPCPADLSSRRSRCFVLEPMSARIWKLTAHAVAALALVLIAAAPGWSRTVKMETAAPVTDQSDESMQAALRSAVEACIRGAAAMGLSWIYFSGAALQGDQLVVQMIASDEGESNDADPGPASPESAPGRAVL